MYKNIKHFKAPTLSLFKRFKLFFPLFSVEILSKNYFLGIFTGTLSYFQIQRKITYGHKRTVALCMHAFLQSADFFKIIFFENFFQEYHQSVKQLGSRSGAAKCRA